MTTHRAHPDPRIDEPYHTLYDNCERCDQQSELLTELDTERLSFFWNLMHASKHQGIELKSLSENEWKVINKMFEMAVILERLTGAWPSPRVLLSMGVGE